MTDQIRRLAAEIVELRAQTLALQAIVLAEIGETLEQEPGDRRLQVNRLLATADKTLAVSGATPGSGIHTFTANRAREIAAILLLQLAGDRD